MKRYLIVMSIVLAIVGLAFVPPKPNPHRPRRTRESPPLYATKTATVTPTQIESGRMDAGAMNSLNESSPTPQIAGARMCLWFTYETGCVAWATVTPVVDIGLPPLPPTLSVPPIEGYPGPAPTQGGYPGP